MYYVGVCLCTVLTPLYNSLYNPFFIGLDIGECEHTTRVNKLQKSKEKK